VAEAGSWRRTGRVVSSQAPLFASLFHISPGLGYLLPALVGLESMGIPSPGETALIVAAIAASNGQLDIWLVIAIAVASAIVGDNIGYAIGRIGGRSLLETPRLPFHGRRMRMIEAGDRFFARHGSKAVFLGRWVALVRVTAAWMAGASRMPFRTFFFWNALGGLTWGLTIGLVAFYAGKAAVHVIEKFGVYAAIAIGVLVVAGVVWLKLRERRELQGSDDDEIEPKPEPPAGV
jgi:membrane-associated protein